MHGHHIVFRSQGGLDFPLNIIYLTYEQHEGPDGPHKNKIIDDALKKTLQNKLYKLFREKDDYTIEEIAEKLGRTSKYFEKHFRKVPQAAGQYKTDDIVKKLMGGKFY